MKELTKNLSKEDSKLCKIQSVKMLRILQFVHAMLFRSWPFGQIRLSYKLEYILTRKRPYKCELYSFIRLACTGGIEIIIFQ